MLRSAHADCERQIEAALDGFIAGRSDRAALDSKATALSAKGKNGLEVFMARWDRAVAGALEDGVLSVDEEKRLTDAAEVFGHDQVALNPRPTYQQLVKAAVLREILEGTIPERLKVQGLNLVLQRGEKIVWVFPNTEYLEQRTIRSFAGVSHGLSIRVMKGVYYRPAMFRGEPVERTTTVSRGKGALVITSKHVSFVGPARTVRLPYKKIVAVQPYRDGIGIQRDAATARPMSFVTGDGWFAYNLVTNLAQMS
jgi:hypothetical protein